MRLKKTVDNELQLNRNVPSKLKAVSAMHKTHVLNSNCIVRLYFFAYSMSLFKANMYFPCVNRRKVLKMLNQRLRG